MSIKWCDVLKDETVMRSYGGDAGHPVTDSARRLFPRWGLHEDEAAEEAAHARCDKYRVKTMKRQEENERLKREVLEAWNAASRSQGSDAWIEVHGEASD